MMGENNCKGLLERVLEITIERGEVSQEKSIGYHQEYKEGCLGDMEILLSGEDYTEFPDTYVIFICDLEPFGDDKYRYIGICLR